MGASDHTMNTTSDRAAARSAAEGAFAPRLATLGTFTLAPAPDWRSSAHASAAWRGAVASQFVDDPRFHGHVGVAHTYEYPVVQYRWRQGQPVLLALDSVAPTVMSHRWVGREVRLGHETHTVTAVDWKALVFALQLIGQLQRYRFVSPWLPLNQENHARYVTLDAAGKRRELDRILRGNLLTAFRELGWTLPEGAVLYAAAECDEVGTFPLKDQQMLGFTGTFVCNAALPEHLAVGRSVSHGYGWVEGA